MRQIELSSASQLQVRGRALNAAKNSFKKRKVQAVKTPTAYLFKAESQPSKRLVLLTKEQAKSLLIAKRDAYLSGKLSCRPAVVKSLIKRFVSMLKTDKVEAKAEITYDDDVIIVVTCPVLSEQDYQFDQ